MTSVLSLRFFLARTLFNIASERALLNISDLPETC